MANLYIDNQLPDIYDHSKFNFRINNKWVLLTYKGRIDKDNLYNFLDRLSPLYFDSCIIAYVNVDDNIYTYAAVDFGKAISQKNHTVFDYEKVHPEIRRCKNKTAFKNVICFCNKYEHYNYGNIKYRNLKNNHQSSDVLSNVTMQY